MAISAREVKQVVDTWGAAGARIEENGKGYRVYPPDGDRPYSMHLTISDMNAHKNMRTWGRRHGLPWPWEYNHKPNSRSPEGQAMSNTASIEIPLPPYITSTTVSASKKRIADVLGAVDKLGSARLEAGEINHFLRQHGRGYATSSDATKTISRVLYHCGYRPIEQRRNGAGQTYTWQFRGGDAVLLDDLPKPTVFPDLNAIVTPIVPESTGGEPVEDALTPEQIHALHTEIQEKARNGTLTVSAESVDRDPMTVTQTFRGEEDDVAEQLLREAEAESERRRAALERMHRERDQARAEVERLQGLLARERSAPKGGDDGSWSVPVAEFVQQSYPDIARIDLATLRSAHLDVSVTFRPQR